MAGSIEGNSSTKAIAIAPATNVPGHLTGESYQLFREELDFNNSRPRNGVQGHVWY